MISDNLTTFCTDQAAGASATATTVGDVIDLKATGDSNNVGDNVGEVTPPGGGQPIYLQIVVSEDFVGTNTTDDITFALVTSANAGLTSGVTLFSVNHVYGTGTDVLDAGDTAVLVALPTEGLAYERYLGIQETVVGATTTGKYSAFLTLDPRREKSFPQADVGF